MSRYLRLLRHAITAFLILLFLLVNSAAAQIINFDYYDGVTHYENGEFEKAVESLKKAVYKDPEMVDAYTYLASAYLGTEQFKQTVETATKGLSIAPNHIRLMLLKAEGYYRIDYRKAIPVYDKIESILKEEPGQQKEGVTLGQVHSYLGRLYQRSANDSYNSGKINKAIEDYMQARQFSPDSLKIHNNLAYILLKEERWNEAVNVLQDATDRFPDAGQLLFMKGQAHRAAGELEKMVEAYHQLYQQDKSNLDYAVIYGQSLMIANKAQKANIFLQQLIKDHPREKRLYEVLIQMNEQRYDFGAKRNVLKLQRKAFPEDRTVAEELAQTYSLIREYKEARVLYDSLATATQNLEYSIQAARTWLHEEKYEEAAGAYQGIIIKWPEEPDVLAEAAIVYEHIGDLNQARELYYRAYEINRKPEVAVRLIELLIEEGQNEEALAYVDNLEKTAYSGIGKYYQLKYGEPKTEKREAEKKVQTAVIEMIQLYDDVQREMTKLSSRALKGNFISKPPLLQTGKVLDRIEHYINDWYKYLASSITNGDASQILKEVIAEYPTSPKLHLFKGKMAITNGNVKRGIQSLEEAVRLGAQAPEIHATLGNAYVQLDEIQPAILAYERALSMNDTFRRAYQSLIKVSQDNNRLNELCNRWMTRYSNNRENDTLRQFLIEALHKAGRFEEAYELIDKE